jgi:hypothetical protein
MGDWVNPPDYQEGDKYYDWDFYEVCEEEGLECYSPDGSSGYAVGLGFEDMGDDETKAQFKKRIADLIFKITGETVDPGVIEEAYYC